MGRARTKPQPKPLPQARRRGRPPMPPRTTLARWLQQREISVAQFATTLASIAPKIGYSSNAAPIAKTLIDSVNGRHWPSAITMLLVRHATEGAVDLEHWVRDLYAEN